MLCYLSMEKVLDAKFKASVVPSKKRAKKCSLLFQLLLFGLFLSFGLLSFFFLSRELLRNLPGSPGDHIQVEH